ncbi:MAG TPA: PRC-barrel domain-containing protein [Candidatus Limnocylindrales bacterium]
MNDLPPAEPETEVSWRVADPGTPIYASDGVRVGTLRQVAADDNEDIFHGLVIDRERGPAALVPRDAVVAIESDRIEVGLDPGAVDRLPEWSDAGASAAPPGGMDT